VRAVEYGRLVEDAQKLRPGLTIPADIAQQVASFNLTPRGTFTSRSGPNSLRDWCNANKTAIDTAVGAEVENKALSKLYQFIEANDQRWDVLMAVMEPFRSLLESEGSRREDGLVSQADVLFPLEERLVRE
jgi:hypothetical protein